MEHRPKLFLLAIGEWLLILPAALLLGAAVLRILGGRGLPARAASAVFDWTSLHLSIFGIAMALIGLPGIVIAVGAIVLIRVWREDRAVRRDALAAVEMIRRRPAIVLLTAAVLAASVIFLLAVGHVITD